jgi:hypothetical protein
MLKEQQALKIQLNYKIQKSDEGTWREETSYSLYEKTEELQDNDQ